jgi:nucleoid-associated protein YgaU
VAGRPVVVHRGDTLWQIVQRWLGPGATDAEVSSAWPQWYAANRAVIGDNPALIQPGQLLHAPGAADRATSHR